LALSGPKNQLVKDLKTITKNTSETFIELEPEEKNLKAA
jgi:hypothetical protein